MGKKLAFSKVSKGHRHIKVAGARVHNLKNVFIDIPKNQLTVVTGLSGSGKSSLVFDTIYAEGQRRYLEAFGSYIRQFMGEMERPDVDSITGISPVIAIEQKTTNRNPRSTVGTVTEVYDFFRLLYARIGKAYSMHTGKPMVAYTEEELLDNLFTKFFSQKIIVLAPLIKGRKGHYKELFVDIAKKGYLRVRIDGEIREIVADMKLDRYKTHNIEVVVDELSITKANEQQLQDSLQSTLMLSDGLVYILTAEDDYTHLYQYSKHFICEDTGISYEEPSPLSFSFNSPLGYCPNCRGLGYLVAPNIDAIIPDKECSVKAGGILPLGEERDAYLYNMVKDVSNKAKINLKKPIVSLPSVHIDYLMHGSKASKDTQLKKIKFEGVLPLITRWFNDTSSEGMRNSLAPYFHMAQCQICEGTRLKKESLFFKLGEKNIAEISQFPLQQFLEWTIKLESSFTNYERTIAKDVIKEIIDRLNFLIDVGLHYLTINRAMSTLSGGESQRIRLATQIGSQLQGITYVLDEPSIGLHPRDNYRLITSLKQLRDIGNTVIVVEHDEEIMRQSDYLIDIGPAAGSLGGKIVAEGKPNEFKKKTSLTAQYLQRSKTIALPTDRRKGKGEQIRLQGVNGNNLKNLDVTFPLGMFIAVTGVSGSGKSTLIGDTLYPLLHNHCYRTNKQSLACKSVKGINNIDKVIEVNQSPIGRTPRSCPATYSGFYTHIRQLFASLPEAQLRGFKAGDFSFNVKGGRCEVCGGVGKKTVEMNFLPDVYILCDGCLGRRFSRDILDIRYKHKSIGDVLDMSVDEAVDFFKPISYIHQKIQVLQDVGLGYVHLGQNALTLSGGEAQRIKLSSELVKKQTGKTIYILDEPTTGLHTHDVNMLLQALQKLVDKGNTVLVIEHHLDVIKVADYIIDLGEEGGDAGGYIVAKGTPEEVSKLGKGYTAQFLKKELALL